MKKPLTVPGAGTLPVDPQGGGWLMKVAPTAWEFLTHETWEDGSPRQTGTLMLLSEDGLLKAWVHDREFSRSVWVSGSTLETLLKALEKALAGEATPWRRDRPQGRSGKK
jgi:hypothetical protein